MRCLKCQRVIKRASFYGLHANCFKDWFKLPHLLEFSGLDPKRSTGFSDSQLDIKKTKDSFYHGQYRKYSAKLASVQYILKVQEAQYPDLPATEYVCNKIASLLNLNVPEYYLIRYQENNKQGVTYKKGQELFINEKSNKSKRYKSGLIVFVTRNFTQDYTGTLNHIYKFLPQGDKNYNCKNIIKVISEQTGKLSDVESFVEICLFDAFIGNPDRHGRNLGIIDTGRNRSLAPMYDNPSFLGTEKDDQFLLVHFNPSGAIRTFASKEPKFLDYIQEFKSLKLEKTCLKFIRKTIKQFPLIAEEVKKSVISERRKQAFINLLEDRLKDCRKSMEEDFKNV